MKRKRSRRLLRHGNYQITVSPKNEKKNGKSTGRKKQVGGFLNYYDFAYAGRDIVNRAGKIAPGIINKVTSDIIRSYNKELIRQSKQAEQKLSASHQK